MPDHVHMMISIPPKYAVSQVIGYVKGKSAIHLARVYGERRRQPSGPRSKSWLRNVVTSQPIRANSWSSPPVRGWRPRTLSPCYSRPRQAREQAPDPDAPPSASRSSHRKSDFAPYRPKTAIPLRPDRATRRTSGFWPRRRRADRRKSTRDGHRRRSLIRPVWRSRAISLNGDHGRNSAVRPRW
jgi:Transposase IS200 like